MDTRFGKVSARVVSIFIFPNFCPLSWPVESGRYSSSGVGDNNDRSMFLLGLYRMDADAATLTAASLN